jgi:hypothetical protein
MVNKAISLVTFTQWFRKNKDFFVCQNNSYKDLQTQIMQIETAWLEKNNVRSVRIKSAKPQPQRSSRDLTQKLPQQQH